MQLIDVIQQKEWTKPLLRQIDRIPLDDHHNKDNYLNFAERLAKYDSFTILVDGGKILAMSGLFNAGTFPSNTIRALDRTYYFNWQNKSLNARYSSSYFWPAHANKAKELGYDSVFFSVQNIKKRRAFHNLAKRCTPTVEILPNLYNTCRRIPNSDNEINQHQSCWQNIAIHKFKDCEFDLPKMDLEEYEQKYKNTTSIR